MSFAYPLALDPVGSAAVTGREPHLHPKQPLAQSLQEGRPEAAPQPFWGFARCVLCLHTQKPGLGTHATTQKAQRVGEPGFLWAENSRRHRAGDA